MAAKDGSLFQVTFAPPNVAATPLTALSAPLPSNLTLTVTTVP